MLYTENLQQISTLLEKINYAFIIKICIEIVLFYIFLKISKTLIEIFFAKIINKIKDHETQRQYSTIKFLCISIVNTVVSLFFLTNLLGAFGIDMKPILATAGVLGVAIGFGAKRFVEDIISGLMILLTSQIRAGDYITIGNSTGTVEKINLALMTIRTVNGDVHYIRNGLVEKVINHTREFSNPIVDIPISYDADVKYVVDVLKELCHTFKTTSEFSAYIKAEPEVIAIDSFGESSVNLKVRFKTTPMQQWAIQRAFRIMVKEKFDQLNISIPYNKLDVIVQNN